MSDRNPLQTQLNRAARLAQDVAALFVAKGLTLALAESFTGGLVSHTLTNVAGSSRFFLAGLCAYSTTVKTDVLGVPETLIERHGVVSGQVAEAMARRVRELCAADVGLGTTGFAGPPIGDEPLSVGTVFIATSTQDTTMCHEFHHTTDRLGTKLAGAIDSLRLLLALDL